MDSGAVVCRAVIAGILRLLAGPRAVSRVRRRWAFWDFAQWLERPVWQDRMDASNSIHYLGDAQMDNEARHRKRIF